TTANAAGAPARKKKTAAAPDTPPGGVPEGRAVPTTGEGEAGGAGGPAGDLHCYIAVKAHSFFSRHNNDLVCQIPISFTQAALGAEIDVPTLDGKEKIELTPGTQHGEVFKLKGKGLPDLRTRRNGDELVQIVVEIPKKLTEKQKQLLRDFAVTEDASVMPQRKGFLDKFKQMFTSDE